MYLSGNPRQLNVRAKSRRRVFFVQRLQVSVLTVFKIEISAQKSQLSISYLWDQPAIYQSFLGLGALRAKFVGAAGSLADSGSHAA